MTEVSQPQTILFSPLGDTDPVRDCYDGACLHILRHYRPDMVVLFYTKEMVEKEDRDHRYTRVIRHLMPEIEIQEIRTEIEKAHLLEEVFPILPDSIKEIHAAHPKAKILLNLSSGTPQIKTLMAIAAVEAAWCQGIQVSSPAKASNRENRAAKDDEDIEAMIEQNLDDDPQAENRCLEPPMRAIAYYGEKNRILSLVNAYEYGAALELAKAIPEMPETARKLIGHAKFRQELMLNKARSVIDHFGNTKLLPYSETKERLVEYFLTMQTDAKKDKISQLAVKIVPFLYEYLLAYLKEQSRLPLESVCDEWDNRLFFKRAKLKQNAPDMLAFMDKKFNHIGLNDNTEISAKTMHYICQYLETSGEVKDKEKHDSLLNDLGRIINYDNRKISKHTLLDIRNQLAHRITNIDRDRFISWTNIEPGEMLDIFWHMLRILYGESVGNQRNMYEKINGWIQTAMNESVTA